MSIVAHEFDGNQINQLLEDTIIAGKTIPKGYCNATEMCKANGKKFNDYTRLKQSIAYIDELSRSTGIPVDVLTVEITTGKNEERGTWVHHEIAIHLGMWVSAKFAVWCVKVLQRVINGEFDALTEEAKEAQAKLVKIWDGLRTVTKESFWFIADAIKAYYDLNPRIEKYPGQNYSEVFDKLNVGLFGKKAKQIKSELGITSGLNRDHFGTESLKRIDMIQRIAEPQIKTGKNPVDSVSFALSIMMYEVMDYRK